MSCLWGFCLKQNELGRGTGNGNWEWERGRCPVHRLTLKLKFLMIRNH